MGAWDNFTPANYEYDGLDLRVRNAIQRNLWTRTLVRAGVMEWCRRIGQHGDLRMKNTSRGFMITKYLLSKVNIISSRFSMFDS